MSIQFNEIAHSDIDQYIWNGLPFKPNNILNLYQVQDPNMQIVIGTSVISQFVVVASIGYHNGRHICQLYNYDSNVELIDLIEFIVQCHNKLVEFEIERIK